MPGVEYRDALVNAHNDITMAEGNVRDIETLGSIVQEYKGAKGTEEFTSVAISPQGQLIATTYEESYLYFFTSKGEIERSILLPEKGDYMGLAFTEEGNILASEYESSTVYMLSPSGQHVQDLIKDLYGSTGVAVHKECIYVSESDSGKIAIHSMDGKLLRRVGIRGNGMGHFMCTYGLCFGPDGCLYVVDSEKNCVHVFDKDHTFVKELGHGILDEPSGIAFTRGGHIAVCSEDAKKVSFFSVNGKCLHEVKDIGLGRATSIAVDFDDFVYIADRDNARIVKL